jgi:seryl-tRNA synthetase
MTEVAGIGDELARSAERLEAIQAELQAQLMALPNLPDASVPLGADEAGNVEVRRWGEPRSLGYPPRDHVDLGAPLGLDFETGTKLSGARFSFLRGPIARLHRAIAQFMLDVQTPSTATPSATRPTSSTARSSKAPASCRSSRTTCSGSSAAAMRRRRGGTGGEQYLISTSEISLTNSVREELARRGAPADQAHGAHALLPLEAGSAGRDTRGMIRQHQFDKVEMVQIVTRSAAAGLEEMAARRGHPAEARAAVPRRAAVHAATWLGAVKTYDLEVWVPAQNASGRSARCSNCEAFQARRMQTRFKNAQGATTSCTRCNGSGLAVGRPWWRCSRLPERDGSIAIRGAAPLHGWPRRTAPMTP